jgi:hypothetical protein
MKSHASQTHAHASAHEFESGSRLTLGERVCAFLRQRHPVKTADNVAADTGIAFNTIKTWLDRASAPNAEGYTALWMAYGPDFLAALADREPAWLRDVRRAQEAAQLKAEIAALELKLSGVRS